jgi:hypothetical protein
MKLSESLLLAASAAFLMIGIHQAMQHGVQNSYFLFMTSAGLFLWYTMRKKKNTGEEGHKEKNEKPTTVKRKKK